MNLRQANFPYNEETAITMLYLEKLDLSHLDPTQLVEKYCKVLEEVRKALNERS
ncbi:hypothetical protein [Lysinibacillus fusiformis]|uniref:hypothetical protein n=1 Tax=Lysinibacillus fusiformis TaxID=28031 RepID=UPI0015864A7A|nr:hypothetical protein [Lysinibacillus fusiformis]